MNPCSHRWIASVCSHYETSSTWVFLSSLPATVPLFSSFRRQNASNTSPSAISTAYVDPWTSMSPSTRHCSANYIRFHFSIFFSILSSLIASLPVPFCRKRSGLYFGSFQSFLGSNEFVGSLPRKTLFLGLLYTITIAFRAVVDLSSASSSTLKPRR